MLAQFFAIDTVPIPDFFQPVQHYLLSLFLPYQDFYQQTASPFLALMPQARHLSESLTVAEVSNQIRC